MLNFIRISVNFVNSAQTVWINIELVVVCEVSDWNRLLCRITCNLYLYFIKGMHRYPSALWGPDHIEI